MCWVTCRMLLCACAWWWRVVCSYVEGTNNGGDAVDFAASIVQVTDDGSVVKTVAHVETDHEGRGASSPFMPKQDTRYQLRVTRPAGVKQVVDLPKVLPEGGVISFGDNSAVFSLEDPMALYVSTSHAGSFQVVLFRREAEIARSVVRHSQPGQRSKVVLTPPSTPTASGVLRLTLYDVHQNKALAERLLFRRPQAMDVGVKADKDFYAPGETVKLTITTSLAGGAAIPARVGITVVDDSVLQKVERNLQPPRLPAMALLEDDVQVLHDPHTYVCERRAPVMAI